MIIRSIVASALLGSGIVAAAPASAVITTFATYTGLNVNTMWLKTGTTNATTGGKLYTLATPSSTTSGAAPVKFNFVNLPYLPLLGNLNATFTFNAVAAPGTAAQNFFGFDVQPLTSGSFKFTYTGADFKVGQTQYHHGDNLLSATFFTGGQIAGADGSTSGSVGAATSAGNTIVYTSDFLNFGSTVEKDFSIGLSSITPTLGRSPLRALNTFKASSTGSFSSDPVPLTTAVIPEPATWGLLVVGFGLVGLQGRRRSRSTSVAA